MFNKMSDVIKETLVEAPQSHAVAKKNVGPVLSFHESSFIDNRQALIRDGYRCVMTGKYDDRCATEIRELNDLILSDPSLRREPTQCAHIFAESSNKSIEPGSAKVRPRVFLTLDNEYLYMCSETMLSRCGRLCVVLVMKNFLTN